MGSEVDSLFDADEILLVFEEVTSDFYDAKSSELECGLLKTKAEKFSAKRVKFVKKYHIIVPPLHSEELQFQYYAPARADVPHYQISGEKGPDKERHMFFMNLYEKHPSKFQIYDRNEGVIKNDFLCVINDVNRFPGLAAVTEVFDFDRVKKLIDLFCEADDGLRNNKFFDRGRSGSQNCPRSKENCGLSTPQMRKVQRKEGNTMEEMTEEDSLFLDAIESQLYEAMKCDGILPTMVDGKDEMLFMVPKLVNRIIGKKNGGFHQTRWALTNALFLLKCHIDTQNGKVKDTLEHSEMNALVGCLSCFKGGERVSLIGYGRESVVLTAEKLELFEEVLSNIIRFYNHMDVR